MNKNISKQINKKKQKMFILSTNISFSKVQDSKLTLDLNMIRFKLSHVPMSYENSNIAFSIFMLTFKNFDFSFIFNHYYVNICYTTISVVKLICLDEICTHHCLSFRIFRLL